MTLAEPRTQKTDNVSRNMQKAMQDEVSGPKQIKARLTWFSNTGPVPPNLIFWNKFLSRFPPGQNY